MGAISYSADIAMQDEKTSEDKEIALRSVCRPTSAARDGVYAGIFNRPVRRHIYPVASALTDLIRKVTGFGSGQQKGHGACLVLH